MTRAGSILSTLVLLGAGAGALPAQGPPAERARLQQELELRFAQQVRNQLGLSDEEATRLQEVMGRYARQRRGLEASERSLRQALLFQLRPGIAADADSVGRLVDRIAEVRLEYARVMQEEMKELASVLTPVQRGQLFLLRDRILQRVQELREQRGRGGPPGQMR